jgi:hypothetical protein
MKAHLLYPDRDFDWERPLLWNEEALTRDLALDTLFNAMARGDQFLFEVAKRVILSGFDNDLETIRYRQKVLQDCLDHPAVLRELYALAVEAVEKEKKHSWYSFMHYPDSVLRGSVDRLDRLSGYMKNLRKIADAHAGQLASEGWAALFTMLQRELSDEYFARIQRHLEHLKFRNGVLLSARLGGGNKGTNYVLHLDAQQHRRIWKWMRWLIPGRLERFFRGDWLTRLSGRQPLAFTFSLHPRDESGAKALAQLRDQGIALVANALAQSADHVCSFFTMLRTELAFYVGCVNLHEQLAGKGEPSCLPVPVAAEERRFSFRGLYDACLALSMDQRVVGNDADADRQDLVVVTGANQGGKSTFLRSVGLAQLMMQCGMFVPAEFFCAALRDGLFTHYRREEDTSMKSGKLDEELRRMSDIVDHLTPHSMILFNESFAATNEREGSEIARQILPALLERRVKIVCVTHLYELANGFYRSNEANALFLRAERQVDGARTFRLIAGEPLPTSFGEDLYASIFGAAVSPSRQNGSPEPI